jgi:hypothetical protein
MSAEGELPNVGDTVRLTEAHGAGSWLEVTVRGREDRGILGGPYVWAEDPTNEEFTVTINRRQEWEPLS